MDSEGIIGSINQIYERFDIAPDLRLHMLKVAGIGNDIVANWTAQSVPINGNDIVAALLIHDLGNVVKFNFDEPKFWAGHSAKDIDHWKALKRDTIERYGSASDYDVTLGMAREIGVNERIMFLLSNMSFGKIDVALSSNDFDLKICMYADQRVGPSGVMSMAERFSDLRERYGEGDNWREEVGLRLEEQIFRNTLIRPFDITESSIKAFLDRHQRMKHVM